MKDGVSIPYRLATNAKEVLFVHFYHILFQFLIGWLQTKDIEKVYYH